MGNVLIQEPWNPFPEPHVQLQFLNGYCQWQVYVLNFEFWIKYLFLSMTWINYSIHRHGMHRHAQQPFFSVSSATRVALPWKTRKTPSNLSCQIHVTTCETSEKQCATNMDKTWQTKHEQQCTCKHGQWHSTFDIDMVNDKHAFSRRFSVRVRAIFALIESMTSWDTIRCKVKTPVQVNRCNKIHSPAQSQPGSVLL